MKYLIELYSKQDFDFFNKYIKDIEQYKSNIVILLYDKLQEKKLINTGYKTYYININVFKRMLKELFNDHQLNIDDIELCEYNSIRLMICRALSKKFKYDLYSIYSFLSIYSNSYNYDNPYL